MPPQTGASREAAYLVSVVIPSHNRPRMLLDALDSVLAQTYGPLEIIVVDDGSVPPVELPERMAHVRVLRNPKGTGVCAARNRGIDAAAGTYVALLDDDDRWRPTKIARQLEAMQRTGARWSFTGCHQVRADGTLDRPFSPAQLKGAAEQIERDNRIGTPSSVVVERELLQEVGAFDPSLRVLADWDLWIRLCRVGLPAPVPETLIEYVIHDGGMHRAQLEAGLQERRQMAARYGLGRKLGGLSYWMWVSRSLRGSGRPVAGAVAAGYAFTRGPGAALARVRRVAGRRLR